MRRPGISRIPSCVEAGAQPSALSADGVPDMEQSIRSAYALQADGDSPSHPNSGGNCRTLPAVAKFTRESNSLVERGGFEPLVPRGKGRRAPRLLRLLLPPRESIERDREFESVSPCRRVSLTNEFRGGKAETPPGQRRRSWVVSLGHYPFVRRFRISCKSVAFHVFSLLPNSARRMLVWTSCGFRVDRSPFFGVYAANDGRSTI